MEREDGQDFLGRRRGNAATVSRPPTQGRRNAEKRRGGQKSNPESGGHGPGIRHRDGRRLAGFTKRPGTQPGIDLGGEGIHRGPRGMSQAMNGEGLLLLPKLNRSRIAIEVGGDLLPAVELDVGRDLLGVKTSFWPASHGVLIFGARKENKIPDDL